MDAPLGDRVLVPTTPSSIFTNAWWGLNGKCIAFGVMLCIIYLIPVIQMAIAYIAMMVVSM